MRFVNTGKFQNNLFSLLSFTSEGFLYTKSKKERAIEKELLKQASII